MLGQHFSKPFNIQYLDKHEKKQHVWQTSWGISTRQLGILIMHHGDDKGAIIPPELSPIQVVIVPILFKGKEQNVLEKSKEIEDLLRKQGIRTYLDDRDYTAGFKFNEWELKGVPLRVEIGPKDIEASEITIVNRIDNNKEKIKFGELAKVSQVLIGIQNQLLQKSRKLLNENIKNANGMDQLRNMSKDGFWTRANWCGSDSCEKGIKAECGGAEIRGTLYRKEETVSGKCVHCGKDGKHVVYVAKAY
jgi:prolyl-tRNA synthetase